MNRQCFKLFAIASVILSVGPPCLAGDEKAHKTDLLAVVRGAVDVLIEHGTDRWGDERTAMIISILDRGLLVPPSEKMPRAPAGVRGGDRTNAFGSNANVQQNLYQAMFLLSEITGEPRYREAAAAALVDFVRKTQSPATDLLGWGEHLFYDLNRDEVATASVGGEPHPPIHEMKKKFLFWDRSGSASPSGSKSSPAGFGNIRFPTSRRAISAAMPAGRSTPPAAAMTSPRKAAT